MAGLNVGLPWSFDGADRLKVCIPALYLKIDERASPQRPAAPKRERRGQKVNQRRFLCQCNRTTAQIGCCDHRTTLLAVDSDAFDCGIL